MSTAVTQFGKMYVFDDELTSTPPGRGSSDDEAAPKNGDAVVGRAQGMYVYCGRDVPSALWSFTAFLRDDLRTNHSGSRSGSSTATAFYNSSLSFHGVERVFTDPNLSRSRQLRPIAVVSGSGRFLDARGIAYVSTVASRIPNYFVLRFDVTVSTPSP
jgi:hypothetical protein